MEGKNGKFAKTILFFLRGVHMIDVTLVLPKGINQEDGQGMKVPCIPAFTGRSNL